MAKIAYVALQQFCESTRAPIEAMENAGIEVRLNTLGRRVKKEELPALLKGVDAVLAGVEPYEADLFAATPALKCISRCGIGCDAIDLDAARKNGIQVFVTADEIAQPVAEMTVAMMLAFARNLPAHIADARAGEWKKHAGVLLSEWTIGLVGYGRIARAVARLLQPFGAKLIVSDPFLESADVPLLSLAELLEKSDVVSLHAARQPSEGYLMSHKEFSLMKPGAYLVNTARGYMVDEKALARALEQKKLGGAALDVYEQEPYVGPLASFPNIILTPHVATLTNASRAAMELRAAQNIVSFFKSSKEVSHA